MKEIFQNVEGYNALEVVINCRAGDITLNYQLNDNPVQHIWQKIQLGTTEYKTGIPMNASTDIVLKLANDICESINIEKIPNNFTRNDLNKMHSLMVSLAITDSDDRLSTLNKLIHVLENKINSKYSEYNANIVFYSKNNEQFIPIKEEHKIWLESNNKWGDLILGYGTLGKDWLDLSVDDDEYEELSIQSTISSETVLCFRPEYSFPKASEIFFYRWATQSKFQVPLHDLNKLSLGRYVLGKLIIDQTLLDYHNNIGNWYIPNHICKLTWNKDIIGNNVTIKNLKFYNGNKYHDMSIDHAQIRSIL